MNAFKWNDWNRMRFLEATGWVTMCFKAKGDRPPQILIYGACLMTCVALLTSANSIATAADTSNRCVQFTLKDQFETTHEFTFPREKPTVLTVADKRGSGDIVGWAHPLAEKFGDKIIIAGLADVSSVPVPLKGLVRSKFKTAIHYPVMLDWEGGATRSFHYTKGKANVYLVSADGRILLHLAGEADAESLKQLMGLIEREISHAHQAEARPQ